MTELLYGLGFLALLSLSAPAGMDLRKRLPNEHLSSENMDAVRMTTGLLVTFAALVLSLQLSRARSAYDRARRNRAVYASELARLDQCLRGLGAPMEQTRLRLRRYTAAVIASTWPDEPRPNVEGMPDPKGMALRGEDASLARLVSEVGLAIDAAAPPDPAGPTRPHAAGPLTTPPCRGAGP